MIEGSITQSLGQLLRYRPHIEIVALSTATATEQLASAWETNPPSASFQLAAIAAIAIVPQEFGSSKCSGLDL